MQTAALIIAGFCCLFALGVAGLVLNYWFVWRGVRQDMEEDGE